jgi:hypothetical protein
MAVLIPDTVGPTDECIDALKKGVKPAGFEDGFVLQLMDCD